MFWNRKKFILVGLFAAATVAIQLLVGTPVVLIFGPAMGAPLMLFLVPLLYVFFGRVLYAPNSLVLLSLIVGLLMLPFPAAGPPGFLPKIIVVLCMGLVMEAGIRFFQRNLWLGSALSGGITSATCIFLLWLFFYLLSVPGVEKFISIATWFALIAFVEGILGGLAGNYLFSRVKEARAIKSLRQPQP